MIDITKLREQLANATKISNIRPIWTGAGRGDYFVINFENGESAIYGGRDVRTYDNISTNLGLHPGNIAYKDDNGMWDIPGARGILSPTKLSDITTSASANLENEYYKKTGQELFGDAGTFHNILNKNDSFMKAAKEAMDNGMLRVNTSDKTLYIDSDKLLENKDKYYTTDKNGKITVTDAGKSLVDAGLLDPGTLEQTKTEIYTEANKPPVYEPTKDTIVNEAEKRFQEVLDRGEPTFIKPEFNQKYVENWSTKLQQMEQPNIDWATKQLGKQVGEQYAFYNPYAVGSGGQIKATEEATNKLLMQTIANRNATALGLGQADYTNDYNAAYNKYLQEQTQREAAQQKLLDIAGYRTAQTIQPARQDYYNMLQRQWNVADYATQQAYQRAEEERQKQYAQEIAAMYQPKNQEWYNQLIEPLAGLAGAVVGNMIAPGVGTTIGYSMGSSLGRSASGNSQGSPPINPYNYSFSQPLQTNNSYLPLNYNQPYSLSPSYSNISSPYFNSFMSAYNPSYIGYNQLGL